MAAAEEEERQKRLKALKEKNDMLIAIKERKGEGQLLKYYAHEKYREHVKEWDAGGWLPIHWAGEAQCKPNVFEVLLAAMPEGVKEYTKTTNDSPKPGGDLPLHLLCQGAITADTEKALMNKTLEKAGAVKVVVEAWPEATWTRVRGKLPLHLATKSGAPAGAVEALVDAYATGCSEKEEGEDGFENLPLHNATLKRASDDVVKKLVDTYSEGASVVNALGQLPIHYAAQMQCTPAVKIGRAHV